MTILPHLLNNQNNEFKNLQLLYSNTLVPFLPHSTTNYSNMVESIAEATYKLALDSLAYWIQDIDLSFRNSKQRKDTYYVKNTRKRTIITPFGELTFKRTIYSFKDKSKGTYTHVDSVLGLPKYDRYDPCVKAMMIELYADQNSMIKVGKIIGERIYSSFSLNQNRYNYAIPRQTVQTTIKNAAKIIPTYSQTEDTPKNIYIMADEKWISNQSKTKKEKPEKQMVKAAVIFEDIEAVCNKYGNPTSRHQLVNKHLILNTEATFWETLYDRINQLYDLEKVEHIYIMGDGASWIKTGVNTLKTATTSTTFSLDKFHLHQSLTRICREKEIRKLLFETIVIDNDKEYFKDIIEALKKDEETKEDTIEKESKYILNNWKYIQNAYKVNQMGCSMESAISHYIASVFSSVPKAYGKNNLEKYIANREQFINNIDIRKTYIQSLDYKVENDCIHLKEKLNFSMFEPRNRVELISTTAWGKQYQKGTVLL